MAKFAPKNLILDVDGVLTDGKFYYTEAGKVAKVFGVDDKDALDLLKDKLVIHMVSNDKKGFTISKKRVTDMGFPLERVGIWERVDWIAKKFNPAETIYMGDGIFDPVVFEQVGYSIAPKNASAQTKGYADFVTEARGGEGAVAEACLHIMSKFFKPFNPLNIKTKDAARKTKA